MTVVFEDAHSRIASKLAKRRTLGADFDEFTCAGDTICFQQTEAMNQFIQKTEGEGSRYGSKLAKTKVS